MKITEPELLIQYNLTINKILDECDWKTHFTGQEVCGIVHTILIKNKEEMSITSTTLYEIYNKKIQDLNISDEIWRENYSVPEIISIIYEILISLDGVDSQVL